MAYAKIKTHMRPIRMPLRISIANVFVCFHLASHVSRLMDKPTTIGNKKNIPIMIYPPNGHVVKVVNNRLDGNNLCRSCKISIHRQLHIPPNPIAVCVFLA
jgi:hypothetical protein